LAKPNVVVILSDTLRWDVLGVNGGPGWLDVKTPNSMRSPRRPCASTAPVCRVSPHFP